MVRLSCRERASLSRSHTGGSRSNSGGRRWRPGLATGWLARKGDRTHWFDLDSGVQRGDDPSEIRADETDQQHDADELGEQPHRTLSPSPRCTLTMYSPG
jgi:hypothetical protein